MQVFTINTPVLGIIEKGWNGVSVPASGNSIVDTPMVNVKIDKTKMERVWPEAVEFAGLRVNGIVFKNPKNPKPNDVATKILGKPIVGNAIIFSESTEFNADWVGKNGKTVRIMSWADVGKNLPAFIPLQKSQAAATDDNFNISSAPSITHEGYDSSDITDEDW